MSLLTKKGRGRPGLRDGAVLPRRAGFHTQVVFDLNALKSRDTMSKYRNGFKFAAANAATRKYMKGIGMKLPYEYPSKNQHGGVMFALPREVSLNGLQAGQILRKTHQAGGTLCQLESVRKMLSYAYQLTERKTTGNYPEVKLQWDSQGPDTYLPPTQKIIAEITIAPTGVAKAWTTEWTAEMGMPYPEWCVKSLLAFDSIWTGCRSVTDLEECQK